LGLYIYFIITIINDGDIREMLRWDLGGFLMEMERVV
jgi:hypothetical protein